MVAPANTFHNEKTTVNHYDEMGSKLKQIVYSYRDRERCMNINRFSITDSTGYTITDFFEAADTTVEKVTTWLCAKGKETKINKSVQISDKETYKEQWDKMTRIVDELSELNLLTSRTITNQIGDNIKDQTNITYVYYFDKSR